MRNFRSQTAGEILANHGPKANISLGVTTTEIIEIWALLPRLQLRFYLLIIFFPFNCQYRKKVKHQRLASD